MAILLLAARRRDGLAGSARIQKSERNEKLHRGDPHSRHETRSQALQLPENSVFPLISESRHGVTVDPILSGGPVVGVHLLLGKFPPPKVLGSGFLSTNQ